MNNDDIQPKLDALDRARAYNTANTQGRINEGPLLPYEEIGRLRARVAELEGLLPLFEREELVRLRRAVEQAEDELGNQQRLSRHFMRQRDELATALALTAKNLEERTDMCHTLGAEREALAVAAQAAEAEAAGLRARLERLEAVAVAARAKVVGAEADDALTLALVALYALEEGGNG